MKRYGFTLAEILITLAIIGVVAAMTIPTLIAKINSIVTDNQQKVFNAKLIKGLNLTKTAGDLNNTYESTYDFLVNGLSKNLKMAKVCDKDHIRDCIPYDKIKFDKSDIEETINVKDVTTAAKLKLNGGFVDTAAFVLADGTPAIVSYNLKCIDDPDKADTTINACLAGIYDINGNRKPNKFGSKIKDNKTVYTGDLVGFNGANVGKCTGIVEGMCILSATNAIRSNDQNGYTLTHALKRVDPNYTMPQTPANNWNDYWQLAYDYCSKIVGGRLPNSAELATIANAIYGVNHISPDNKQNRNVGINWDNNINKNAIFTALGIPNNTTGFLIWSSEIAGTEGAWERVYTKNETKYFSNARDGRGGGSGYAICIED